MSRDDSYLYSGMTSASSEPLSPRLKQREEKEHVRQKMKPATQIVLAAIDKERQAVTDVRSYVLEGKTEESLLAEMQARRLYIGYLNGLEAKIKNITKEPKK